MVWHLRWLLSPTRRGNSTLRVEVRLPYSSVFCLQCWNPLFYQQMRMALMKQVISSTCISTSSHLTIGEWYWLRSQLPVLPRLIPGKAPSSRSNDPAMTQGTLACKTGPMLRLAHTMTGDKPIPTRANCTRRWPNWTRNLQMTLSPPPSRHFQPQKTRPGISTTLRNSLKIKIHKNFPKKI